MDSDGIVDTAGEPGHHGMVMRRLIGAAFTAGNGEQNARRQNRGRAAGHVSLIPQEGGYRNSAKAPSPGRRHSLRQAALPHFCRRRRVAVVERMVLDKDAFIGWRKPAESHARCSVIRRRADDACVMPEAATSLTGERETAMPSYNAVATGSDQFLLDFLVAAGEDETVDAGHAAMNDNKATAVDLEHELLR
jgi:hypothetical protein